MEEDGPVHRSTRKRRKKLDGEPELEDTEEDNTKGRTDGAPSFWDMVVNGGADIWVPESIDIPNTDNATMFSRIRRMMRRKMSFALRFGCLGKRKRGCISHGLIPY